MDDTTAGFNLTSGDSHAAVVGDLEGTHNALSIKPGGLLRWERIRRSSTFLPFALLIVFLLVSLITVFTQAHKYGISYDEPTQETYGVSILSFYHTLGKDRSFLWVLPSVDHMPEHGGILDAGIIEIQRRFASVDPWLVRHTVTGVAGWLGIIGIALCGFELGGPWVALAAAIGLWLFPRYYGAIYNNPKDVPAAATLAFVLWATLLLVKHWNERRRALALSALLGGLIGVSAAIRVTALSWFAVLAVLLAGWWLLNGRSAWRDHRLNQAIVQQALAAMILGVSMLLTTMALWPFILLNPIKNLPDAINVLSHYPWDGNVLFAGQSYPAVAEPQSYVPVWIVIGSPPMLLVLAVLGTIVIVATTIRRRQFNTAEWVLLLGFAVTLAPLLLLHPVLYDSLRQFLYIFPPLILLGAVGLVRTVSWLRHQPRPILRGAAVALVAVTLVSYVQVVTEMIALSPYEYAYFSPVVGGLQGAAGKYDTDYYGTCTTAAEEWLAQNYQRYTSTTSPTVQIMGMHNASYLPSTFGLTFGPTFVPAGAYPDFYISYTRDQADQQYPTYKLIHVVSAEGVPLCVVKMESASGH